MVLVQGRPHALTWENAHARAMLAAWLPGEEAVMQLQNACSEGKSRRQAANFLSASRGPDSSVLRTKPSGGLRTGLVIMGKSPKPLYPFDMD